MRVVLSKEAGEMLHCQPLPAHQRLRLKQVTVRKKERTKLK